MDKVKRLILTKSQTQVIERMVGQYRKNKTTIKVEKVVRPKGAEYNTVILCLFDTGSFWKPRKYKKLDGSGKVRKADKPELNSYTIVLKERFFKKLYSSYRNMEECGMHANKLRNLGDPESAYYLSTKCGDRKDVELTRSQRLKALNARARELMKEKGIKWPAALKEAGREIKSDS